jgi:hypothetical protein
MTRTGRTIEMLTAEDRLAIRELLALYGHVIDERSCAVPTGSRRSADRRHMPSRKPPSTRASRVGTPATWASAAI